jgi:hypothetical protein
LTLANDALFKSVTAILFNVQMMSQNVAAKWLESSLSLENTDDDDEGCSRGWIFSLGRTPGERGELERICVIVYNLKRMNL